MERFYRFANITFRIRGEDDWMFREDGVLSPFRVEGPDYDHSVSYEVTQTLPEPEGECVFRGARIQVFRKEQVQTIWMGETELLPEGAHTRIRSEGNHSSVQVIRTQVPERIMPRLVLNTLQVEHHIVRHGGFLLHSAFVRWGDRAILFTAPSGTGKSTQAELWRKHRSAEILNGDRTAVTVGPDGVMAHGIPYCGTSGISREGQVPVTAIVYLSQGPRSEIRPLKGLRAFRCLWEGCSVNVWDKEDVDLCSKTVLEALDRVRVVHLSCTPDEQAVQVLEDYLKGRGDDGTKKD